MEAQQDFKELLELFNGHKERLLFFPLGREQYIANKRATDRKKDLADLEALGEE